MRTRLGLLLIVALAGLMLVACGGSGSAASAGKPAPAGTVSPTKAATVATNAEGTPETTPVATQEATAAATEAATLPPTQPPAPTRAAERPVAPAGPPTAGRWIDVDVSHYVVRLMDGQSATKTITPIAVGAQIDTGIYNSTATGLFHVYSKTADLTYDAPYDTYISNWVGFDPTLDNGFHSFLEDANGKVVDASTGRVSNGCIRTGDSAAIYAFAEIGMPVYVHS